MKPETFVQRLKKELERSPSEILDAPWNRGIRAYAKLPLERRTLLLADLGKLQRDLRSAFNSGAFDRLRPLVNEADRRWNLERLYQSEEGISAEMDGFAQWAGFLFILFLHLERA